MSDDLTRFERHLLRHVPGRPGITAKDLAARLGMGVLPVLATLSSLRARGHIVRRVEWEGAKLRDIRPARWSVELAEDEAA